MNFVFDSNPDGFARIELFGKSFQVRAFGLTANLFDGSNGLKCMFQLHNFARIDANDSNLRNNAFQIARADIEHIADLGRQAAEIPDVNDRDT